MKPILTNSELSVFAGQLALILHSGISVLEGISILKEDSPSQEGTEILTLVYDSLEMTGDFALALRESGVYPEYFIKMTELGERSGTLEEVMDSLSTYYEKQHNLLTGIRDALTYPMILLGMLLAILLVLMTQVMPVFEATFKQLGIETGSLSDTVFFIGNLLQNSSVIILLLITAAVIFCFVALHTGKGKDQLFAVIFKIPFVQKICREMACARFANALSISIHSGLDMYEGFSIACALTEHRFFLEILLQVSRLMEEGTDLADALRITGVFTGMDARMISIGFKTGSPETALAKISIHAQEHAENSTEHAAGMLEPIFTAILSILTGIILVSVMLPLLNVMSSLGL